jgi:hypothetical protein
MRESREQELLTTEDAENTEQKLKTLILKGADGEPEFNHRWTRIHTDSEVRSRGPTVESENLLCGALRKRRDTATSRPKEKAVTSHAHSKCEIRVDSRNSRQPSVCSVSSVVHPFVLFVSFCVQKRWNLA